MRGQYTESRRRKQGQRWTRIPRRTQGDTQHDNSSVYMDDGKGRPKFPTPDGGTINMLTQKLLVHEKTLIATVIAIFDRQCLSFPRQLARVWSNGIHVAGVVPILFTFVAVADFLPCDATCIELDTCCKWHFTFSEIQRHEENIAIFKKSQFY